MHPSFGKLLNQYVESYLRANPESSWNKLSKKIKISDTTLHNWKSEKTLPGREMMEDVCRLAQELNLTPGEFIEFLGASKLPYPDELLQKYEPNSINLSVLDSLCPAFVVDRPRLMGELYQTVFPEKAVNGETRDGETVKAAKIQTVLLHGVAGAGKTTLLAHWIRRFSTEIQHKFPDGLIWIEFENLPDENNAAAVLAQIGNQTGLQVPPENEWSISQKLRGKKYLWVLDGSPSYAAIQKWVNFVHRCDGFCMLTLQDSPDPGWLSQYQVKKFTLSSLEPQEALALTESVLQAPLLESEIADWEAAVNWVGYHALSIRILAGVASFDPAPARWSHILEDLHRLGTNAIRLGGAQGATDKSLSVTASMIVSYQQLQEHQPEAAGCFRALGMFASPRISPNLVGLLFNDDAKSAYLLNLLTQAGLLELDLEDYRIHPISHAFAKTELIQNEQEWVSAAARYVSAVEKMSRRDLTPGLNLISQQRWGEYLHAIEVASEIGLFGDMLAMINNLYRPALIDGRDETILERSFELLNRMKENPNLYAPALPFLHKIVGDLILARAEPVQAMEHFRQVLLLSNIDSQRIQTHLSQAVCAFYLDDIPLAKAEIGAAEKLIELNPDRVSTDILQDLKNTRKIVFSLEEDPEGNSEGDIAGYATSLRQAGKLIDEEQYSQALQLLETMLTELEPYPVTVVHMEGWLLQIEGYLKAGEIDHAGAALKALDEIMKTFSNPNRIPGFKKHLWQLKVTYNALKRKSAGDAV